MRHDYCDITAILDRSGSMNGLEDDVIGGFNRFLSEQQAVPGKGVLTLIQFDDQYQKDYEAVPLAKVHKLNKGNYVPRGATALLDALGKTIVTLGERLAAMPESERPGKVVVLINTDGFENASREFSRETIREMIEKQTNEFNWQFVYLGANVDAFAEAGSLGVAQGTTSNFMATARGVSSLYAGISQSLTSYRADQKTSMAFTADERKTIDSGE